jgi:uncharacterized membrane protein
MAYRSPIFILMVMFMATLLVVALGPGLWGVTNFAGWYQSWQREALSFLCHQQPERSFHLSGVPMAVCSRCFGIYTAFFVGLLLTPISSQSNWRSRYALLLIVLALSLNMVDFVAYTAGLWQNTLFSRFLAGTLLGGAAAYVIGTTHPIKLKGIQHNGT